MLTNTKIQRGVIVVGVVVGLVVKDANSSIPHVSNYTTFHANSTKRFEI